MGITVKSIGGSSRTIKEFERLSKVAKDPSILVGPGNNGVNMFRDATPKDSGVTASKWHHDERVTRTGSELVFSNDNVTKDGIPIVVLIKNGHGTGTGGYIPPNDFITPVVNKIVDDVSSALERKL